MNCYYYLIIELDAPYIKNSEFKVKNNIKVKKVSNVFVKINLFNQYNFF